jgi:hypothetical protein
MVVTTWNPRQDPIVHPFLQPDEHCVCDVPGYSGYGISMWSGR